MSTLFFSHHQLFWVPKHFSLFLYFISLFRVPKHFLFLFILFLFGILSLIPCFTTALLRFLLSNSLSFFMCFPCYYPECCLLPWMFIPVCCLMYLPMLVMFASCVCTFLTAFLFWLVWQLRNNSHFCSPLWKINVVWSFNQSTMYSTVNRSVKIEGRNKGKVSYRVSGIVKPVWTTLVIQVQGKSGWGMS